MFSDESGFFSFFLLSGLVIPLVVIGLVVLGVVAISRSDFDPTGRRPYAFYLYAVCLVSLFVLVFSAAATVSTLSRFVGDDEESFIDFSDSGSEFDEFDDSDDSDSSSSQRRTFDPETGRFVIEDPDDDSGGDNTDLNDEKRDAIIRDAMQVGMAGLVALGLFAFHWNRAQKLVAEPDFPGSPASRVYSSYLYLVCFISAMVILVAGAIAAYAAFRVAFPGVTSDFGGLNKVEREAGFRELASSGVMAAIAALLALIHWRQIYRPAAGGPDGSQPTLTAPDIGGSPPPAYGGPVASPYPPPPAPPDSSYRRPPE